MRNFRKIVCRLCVVVLVLAVFSKGGRYLYESVRDTTVYTREELKETKGTVETLLLGTSLVHWGMDPAVVSRELDTVCFNLATDVQPISGSYYLLKDQIASNPIKRVFLGTGVSSVVSDTNTRVGRRLTILERMLSPAVKVEYMLKEGNFSDLDQILIYPTRVENVLDLETIKRNISYKQSEEFKNKISPKNARWQYRGMGFQSNDQVYQGDFQEEEAGRSGLWDREKVLEENVEYLRKMAELCRENDVEFNLVILPHAWEFAQLQGDLSDMDAYFEEFCAEEGIGLFDYNYTAREDIYDILPTEYFWDKKHLNQTGAAAIAGLLCDDYKERQEP